MNATKVNAGPAESNGRLLLGIWRDSLHVTCGLTACTPGSATGPTLGNEYGKTLPLLFRGSNSILYVCIVCYGAVYLRTRPETVLERIHRRGRQEELTIPLVRCATSLCNACWFISAHWSPSTQHTWSLMNRFRTGQAHVMLACTNGVSLNHLPVVVASDRP